MEKPEVKIPDLGLPGPLSLARIPILDLNGLTPFQALHGNTFELVMQGTRASAMFKADEKFYKIAEQFSRNEPVNILDFLNCQRQIRAMLLSLKAQQGGSR